jgi:signal transduction histidine kinase
MRSSQRTQHVPIIFVTAGARDPLRLFRGYDQGAVDFLYKPIEAPILLSKAEVFFDMYRQRQQLAEELKSRTQALQLNEMCMGVLGHDLRNPLNAILLNARVLLMGEGNDVQERARSIIRSGERMARMIEDLLDVTRARLGGGLNASRVQSDIRPIIEAVINEHRAAHTDNAITLDVKGDFNGCWDCDRIAQAVSNIVGNAIEHGETEGNISIEIDGTASESIVIRVGNRGEISPDLLPSIFDPFSFRSMQSRRSGLGLGLFIVQQIVQAHNGNINVQSRDGFTVIDIELPRLKC